MDQQELKSSGKRLIRTALVAALMLVVVSTILTRAALTNIRDNIRSEAGNALAVVLDTTIASLKLWHDGNIEEIVEAASSGGLAESVATLLDDKTSSSQKAIIDELLHTRFFELQRLQGHDGFDLVSIQGQTLLSTSSASTEAVPMFFMQYVELIQAAITLKQAVYVPPTRESHREGHSITSHFVAPIVFDDNVIALLASHHSPQEGLTSIAQLGRIGRSGETYLINEQGLLASESRFNIDLINAGLLAPNQTSILNVAIKNPGADLTANGQARQSREQQPHTLMAQSALKREEGSQLTGYRDYRGVPVLGVWKHVDFLSLGITSEIDVTEALQPYFSARTTIVSLLAVSLSFALVLGGLLYFTSARTARVLQQAAKELETEVRERTFELHKTAEELRNERTIISTVFHAVPDPIFCKTTDGHYFRVNQAFASLLSKPVSEIEGKHDSDLYSTAEVNAFAQDDKETLQSSEPRVNERWTTVSRDHQVFFETRKSVITLPNDAGKLILGVSRDFTEHKQAEQNLKLATQQANNANAAKSEFLARMSHEIRTPMNGVIGMLELLTRSSLNADQKQKINVAKSSAEGLLTVINDILDFSKIEAGKLPIEAIDFNIRQLIEESAQALAIRADGKDVELLVDVSGIETETVCGDPLRIRQVLTNLIGNAIKFTSDGEIFVEASLRSHEDGWRLNCRVSDTGIGIPSDNIPTLFESFSQIDSSTTRNYGGSGLGLAIVKRLVNLMGGEISVDSQVNKGSCFAFSVSLRHASSSLVDIPQVKLNDWRVLIVDDNQTNLDILKSHLENWGASITSTSHVDEALDVLRLNQLSSDDTTPPEFELIITDMHMPDKDGLSLTESVRQYYDNKALPILMLSSVSSQIPSIDLARLGLDGCLTKPVVTSDLYNAIALIGSNKTSVERKLFVSEHALQRVNKPTISRVKWPEHTRILLVEDNQINRMVAEGLLEGMGLLCEHAEHGEQALTLLRTHSPDYYDAILMDCQMPVLDGYETTRQIRSGKAGSEVNRIPIIAMTANALKGDREKCLAAGMDEHLSKPIDVDALRTSLQEALNAFECVFSERRTVDYTSENNQASSIKEPSQALVIPNDLLTMDWQDAPPSLSEQPELFLKSLLLYINQYQDIDPQLQFPANTEEAETLKRLVHTIKGTSGNMGFVSVFEQAKLVEQQLEEDQLQTSTLSQFQHLMSLAIRDAKLFIEANHVSPKTLDSNVLTDLLSELKPLLERSEVIPSQLLEKLAAQPDSAFSEFNRDEFTQALASFDYDTALEMLNAH